MSCENKSLSLAAAAENCKKLLKNVKTRSAAVSAGALVISALAMGAAASLNVNTENIGTVPAEEVTEASVIPPVSEKEYEVRINVDGKTFGVKCVGTVSDALSKANVTVNDDDLINIGLSEPLNKHTNVVINRVDIVEEVEVKTIEYATKYREDDTMKIGLTETVVDGEEGEIETTLRHVYVDGELVSSAVIDEDVTEPVDEIVVIGTKEPEPVVVEIPEAPVPKASGFAEAYSKEVALDANGVPFEYSQILTGSSCAYTAPAGALTSTGKAAEVGLVAVNPNIIPYGTEMYIVSADGTHVYGHAVAADTGGAVMKGSIIVDLFMASESDCYAWGRRNVNIYVLN